VAGHIQSGFVATRGVLQAGQDGKLKGLAGLGARRTTACADVPTVARVVIRIRNRFGLVMMAPKDIPEPIRAILGREVRQVAGNLQVQQRLAPRTWNPSGIAARRRTLAQGCDREMATLIQSATSSLNDDDQGTTVTASTSPLGHQIVMLGTGTPRPTSTVRTATVIIANGEPYLIDFGRGDPESRRRLHKGVLAIGPDAIN